MNPLPNIPRVLLDIGLTRWESFRKAAVNAGVHPPEDPAVIEEIIRVFSLSEFATKSALRDPEMIKELVESGDLNRFYRDNEYPEKIGSVIKTDRDDPALARCLRKVRTREMVRIAWRDLMGRAPLFEVMAELSAFADACLHRATSLLYHSQCEQYGTPIGKNGSTQHLVVIAMGKLGGRELNFSSDIDLVFAYPEAGKTVGAPSSISNEDFFARLCRRLIRVIGESTGEGMVFRVDMRLRPFGENGPLAMSFDSMDAYYQSQGREWERYAWIKARVAAGDREAGGRLLRMLKPFVFRRYLDYGAFDSLRDMKRKISLEIQRKGIKGDIKIGPGGIREIEFFGQVFQLIRGGVESVLQEQSIQKVLDVLEKEGYIPQEVWEGLTRAYAFLRNTEHRIQEFSDRQTHKLPVDPLDRLRLAVSMGFEDWPSFVRMLDRRREMVHTHFNGLLSQPGSDAEEEIDLLSGLWQGISDPERNSEILTNAGFERPGEILRLLSGFRADLEVRMMSRESRERMDKLVPAILRRLGESANPEIALTRILELLKAIESRACYMALLLENPDALTHLVKLASISPWVISFLSTHPVLLDELLDPRTLYNPPEREELQNDLRQRLERLPPEDLEYQMEELCIFKQTNTFRVVASDVTGGLPLMKVSDRLSYIAETALDRVFELSWRHMVKKYGKPSCVSGNEIQDSRFAVIAYGKLGGLELGYGSDLDLVFLHDGGAGQTMGEKPLDNRQFYARLGQRIIHILTAHTAAGVLYDIDMRLRPSGSGGVLVSHVDAYQDYLNQKAWTWEHQALIRARAVCGDSSLKDRFERIRKAVIAMPREKTGLRDDVKNMRERMRRELLKPEPGIFDLKQGRGGIVDIEFLVQYLVLLHAGKKEALTRWSDNVRLIETLDATGVIDADSARLLQEAYLTFRAAVHRLSLQEKPAHLPEEEFADLRQRVTGLCERILDSDGQPVGGSIHHRAFSKHFSS